MSSFRHIFKYINSLPFSLTILHYFPFDETTRLLKDGELNSVESWDILREHHPHFSISDKREEWLRASENEIKKDGQDGGLVARAKDIVAVLNRLHITSLFSAGSGGAGLEYQIKKMKPDVHLVCSEYSPVAVERLQKVFIEADKVILFDIKNRDWSVTQKSSQENIDTKKHLTLLYRIDIHFTNTELKEIFKNMHDSGIENILLVLCGRITILGLRNRLKDRLKWKLTHTPFVFAGYLRTEKTFEKFWKNMYTATEVDCGGLKSFFLKRIQ